MESYEPPVVGFQCIKCEKCYSNNANLMRHLRDVHKEEPRHLDHRRKISCALCRAECTSKTDLERHLKSVHEITVAYEEHDFDTLEECHAFKADVELRTNSVYKKLKAATKNKTVTYYCRRGGYFQSHSKGLRMPRKKPTGTIKINSFCPSQLKIVTGDSKFRVVYCKTHLGHTDDPGPPNFLSSHEEADVSAKLELNVPIECVFNDIKDSLLDEKDRREMSNQRDILSITSQYNISSSGVLNASDVLSLDMWVEDLGGGANSPVLLYKKRGSLLDEFPLLNSEDYLLVMMNDTQREMMTRCGKYAVGVDFVAGVNASGVNLITLMVLDRKREGFPVCFVASNRLDAVALSVAFVAVKRNISVSLRPEILVTDDDDVYPESWCGVFGEPKRHLLSTWDVDRRFREQIVELVVCREDQANMYKLLRTLLVEPDISRFHSKLRSTRDFLDENDHLKHFGGLFNENYGTRCELWATSYRRRNSMKNFEKIHRVLEYVFAAGEMAKRLDEALHCLSWFARDLFLQLPLPREQLLPKIALVRKSHKDSFELQDEDIFKTSYSWLINSRTRMGETFSVTQQPDCREDCVFLCKDCQHCLHSFKCTCIDNIVHYDMCRHIHAVCRKLKDGDPYDEESSSNSFNHLDVLCVDDHDDFEVVDVSLGLDDPPGIDCQFGATLPEDKLSLKAEIQELYADLGKSIHEFESTADVTDLGELKDWLSQTLTTISDYKDARMPGPSASMRTLNQAAEPYDSDMNMTPESGTPTRRKRAKNSGLSKVCLPSGDDSESVIGWLFYS